MRSHSEAVDERHLAGAQPAAGLSISTLGFLLMFWRRKAILLSVAAIIFVFGVIQIYQLPTRYTATAELRLGLPRSNIIDLEAVVQAPVQNYYFYQTEIAVIKSRQLAERVARKYDLASDPVFNPTLRPPPEEPGFTRYLNPSYYLDLFKSEMRPEPSNDLRSTPVDLVSDEDRPVLTAASIARGMLSARQRGQTSIIAISAQSANPRIAAELANAFAEEYLNQQYEMRFTATERATEWLSDRLESLRQELEAADQAVQQFRARTGVLASGDSTLLSAQVSEVNSQLIAAETELATFDARSGKTEDLYARGGTEAVLAALQAPEVARLQSQQSDLVRRVSELSEELGERHPRMIALRVQIEDIEEQIEVAVSQHIQGLRNDRAVLQSRITALKENLRNLQREAGGMSGEAAQLRTLEREAAAKQALFDTFLNRFQETSAQEDIQQVDAEIISRAEVPGAPSYPPADRYLSLVLFLSLGVGAGAALFVDRVLDRGFRTQDQIEALTGLTALAAIPRLGDKNLDVISNVLEKPNSAFTESLRNLHAGVRLSALDEQPKVLLQVSSVPGEGKTTVSSSFAAMLASSGHKVLLIDGDLRRGRVHERFGLELQPGLVDILLGELPVDQAIQHHDVSGIDVVTGGKAVRSPQDVLGSHVMEIFVEEMRSRYDYVIIDTPPVAVVSEARLLASTADRVIMIVHWNKTPRETVVEAVNLLRNAGAHFAGVVLSQVDARKASYYGYGSNSNYYGKYGSYYHD